MVFQKSTNQMYHYVPQQTAVDHHVMLWQNLYNILSPLVGDNESGVTNPLHCGVILDDTDVGKPGHCKFV
jgi:hypothetical protein